MVTIAIEVLAFFVVVATIIFVWLWYKISRWIAERGYKPENDKGKLAEDERRHLLELAERERRVKQQANAITRQREFERRESIQTATSNVLRKDSDSSRKTSRSIRDVFKRRRK